MSSGTSRPRAPARYTWHCGGAACRLRDGSRHPTQPAPGVSPFPDWSTHPITRHATSMRAIPNNHNTTSLQW